MKRLLILLLVFACLFVISCDMIDTSMFEFNAEYFTVEFDSDGGSSVDGVQLQHGRDGCRYCGLEEDVVFVVCVFPGSPAVGGNIVALALGFIGDKGVSSQRN